MGSSWLQTSMTGWVAVLVAMTCVPGQVYAQAAEAVEPASAPTPDPAPGAQPGPAPAAAPDAAAAGAATAQGPTPPEPKFFGGGPKSADAPARRLGGDPEPEIEKGDWDPWEHVYEGSRRHEGFYLRLALGLGPVGIGSNNVVAPDEADEVSYSGLALSWLISIGGALTNNLILSADLFYADLLNPAVELKDAEEFEEDYDSILVGGLGMGLTWYIMPINLYLSGALGLGQVTFENRDGQGSSSDTGLVANLLVGKEWWVSAEWGVGAAFQLMYVRASDPVDGTLRGLAGAILFSATYN